nr:cytochrome p450 314A1a [Polyphagotarsonemus latus]
MFFKNSRRFISFDNKACKKIKKSFEDVPGPKPSIPLIGTSWQYLKFFGEYDLLKLHEANIDKFKKYGSILKEEFEWKKPVVHLQNPEDFETVFRNQGIYPNRPINEFVCHYRSNNKQKYANVGISNLLGEEWFEQRKLYAPVLLKLGALDIYLDQLNEISNDLIKYIDHMDSDNQNSKVINDIQSLTYNLSLESICMLCLDIRMNCFEENLVLQDGLDLIESTKKLFSAYQNLYYNPPLWKLFETKDYKDYYESEDAIYQIVNKYVQRAYNQLENNSKNSLLKTLVSLNNLDKRDIKTLLIDFISGGINTVSTSLSFILFHIASNPEVQNKLYLEIKNVLGKNKNVESDHLKKLKYLKACVKESFRLNSPIPCLVRVLPKKVILSGYEIPEKTTIFSHFFAICRSEKYFNKPLDYIPERWIGKEKTKINPFSLLPFGFGTKMCTGRRFSEIQIYLTIIKIISNYELKSITKEIDLLHSFILIPEKRISIAFKKRNSDI